MTIKEHFTVGEVYENIKICERTDKGSNLLFQLSRRVEKRADISEIPSELHYRIVKEIMGTKNSYQLLIIVE